jgi:tRNA dimethylallyltransferase
VAEPASGAGPSRSSCPAPPLLPILIGPTASGKTALALAVAERLDAEILSADSRQAYGALAVATAAPTAAEQARVPHHLVGHLALNEESSAGRFAREARAVLGLPAQGSAAPAAPGRLPFLMVGGSLFYIRAFLDPVDPRLAAVDAQRAQVKALGTRLGAEGLRRHLLELDPGAAWIPAADRAKVERYLEISLAAGAPASQVLREWLLPRPVRPLLAALTAPADWLAERIRARSWRLLHGGMIGEIAAALAAGAAPEGNALKSVGVAEVQAYLAGQIDLPRCHDLLVRRTRRYAKKQLTWIRGLGLREPLLLLDARRPLDELADEVCAAIAAAEEGAS